MNMPVRGNHGGKVSSSIHGDKHISWLLKWGHTRWHVQVHILASRKGEEMEQKHAEHAKAPFGEYADWRGEYT